MDMTNAEIEEKLESQIDELHEYSGDWNDLEASIWEDRMITLDVELYKIRQKIAADAQADLDEVKARIKGYLEEQELTSLEVGDYTIKVTQINRETIETKIAKVLIPKKYLDQVLKTSSYSQLRVDRKKEA